MTKKGEHIRQRLMASLVALIGLMMALLFASYELLQPLFAVVVAGIVGIGLQEYYRMAQKLNTQPVSTAAIFCSTIYILSFYLSTQDPQWQLLPYLALTFSFVTIFVNFFFKGDNPLLNFAVTTFGIIWITIPLSFILGIIFYFPANDPGDGRLWFFYLLALTYAADSGGYFVGSQWGTRRLAPKISPNKTIEGAVGGLLISLTVSLIFWAFLSSDHPQSPFNLNLAEAIGLGLLLGLMAALGDLAESLLKRDAKVKDSNTIPGLGGVLDMVDSMIFTTPVLYLFLIIR